MSLEGASESEAWGVGSWVGAFWMRVIRRGVCVPRSDDCRRSGSANGWGRRGAHFQCRRGGRGGLRLVRGGSRAARTGCVGRRRAGRHPGRTGWRGRRAAGQRGRRGTGRQLSWRRRGRPSSPARSAWGGRARGAARRTESVTARSRSFSGASGAESGSTARCGR